MRSRLVLLLLTIAFIATAIVAGRHIFSRVATSPHGPVIHETVSEFSRIRVRERDGIRRMLFVDEQGREQVQSAIDLDAPESLQLAYSRSMFLSFLFKEDQKRVLLVGLGGGGMVRFLQHARPDLSTEVVEIDPAVVEIADRFFGTREGPRTTIHTADAFEFLAEPHGPYDVIYMDAFLRPPADSGLEVLPARLKTVEFLEEIRRQLAPDGIVVFNLIETEESTAEDLAALQSAFKQVYVFSVPRTSNLTVVASQDARLAHEAILARADALARRRVLPDVPLRELARYLREPNR